jgi:hypothetical protein
MVDQIALSHRREFYQWHPIKSINSAEFRISPANNSCPSFLSRHNPYQNLRMPGGCSSGLQLSNSDSHLEPPES